jgi:hypothetical protein
VEPYARRGDHRRGCMTVNRADKKCVHKVWIVDTIEVTLEG